MDRFEISILRSYYGALLTDRQNEMLRLRYDEDMSLGEIAEEFSVSRQTVQDTILKGEKHLVLADGALGLIDKDTSVKRELEKVKRLALSGTSEEIIAAVNNILEIMEG